MANHQVAQGTSGNVSLTGPGTEGVYKTFTFKDSSGNVLATGPATQAGSSTPVNGYSYSYASGNTASAPTSTLVEAVTIPANAAVQTGVTLQIAFSEGSVYSGTFDVVAASGGTGSPPAARRRPAIVF